MKKTPRVQSRGRRVFRRVFRAVRITIMLVVLVLVAVLVYLNEVGLPEFVKRPLLARLHERGVDLQFTRVRLRFHRGIVAENVRFGGADHDPSAPQFNIKEVQLEVGYAALAKFTFDVDSLVLHDGELVWRVEEPGEPLLRLAVTNIQTQLRFQENDRLELGHFTAAFAGARLQVSGSITNASAMRDWKILQHRKPATPGAFARQLREFARILDMVKLEGSPELILDLGGDARDPLTFGGLLTLNAPGAQTPWGTLTNGALIARISPPNAATNQPQARVELRADGAGSRWGALQNFQMHLQAVPDGTLSNVVHAKLDLSADRPVSEWGRADQARVIAEWSHDLTNPVPVMGNAEVVLTNLQSRWGAAGSARVNTSISSRPTNAPPQSDAQWGFWAGLEPYFLDWNCRFQDVRGENSKGANIEFGALDCSGLWRAPDLTVTNIHTELYDGKVDAHAVLNVATRVLSFESTSDFEVKKTLQLFPDNGRRWMEQYGWERPPLVLGAGAVKLPPWTVPWRDVENDVMSNLWLRGEITAGGASFRGVPVTSAHFHFSFSNMVWELPDLVATRPEGNVELLHISDEATHRYFFRVHSTADAAAMRGLLEPAAQRGLDFFQFTQPPVIDADIWGVWQHREQTGLKARVAITNFMLRGESVSNAHADIQFTNNYVIVTNARAEVGARYITADGLGIDVDAKKLYLTNGFSTLEPAPFFRVIGPRVAAEMEPYQFGQPPTVRASGVVPLDDLRVADIKFVIDGGPFTWSKFHLDHISGGVNWVSNRVNLAGVKAATYRGALTGAAAFDFEPEHGTDFSFSLAVVGADLHSVMADLSSLTNHLEGVLDGQLDVTRANTSDWQSWQGGGNARLRDGLIWEIPIFGFVSPYLDEISPGLGKSRATDGVGTYTITNSIIHSSDLEIHSTAMRLHYEGAVDFNGVVDARVEAKLLRDTPIVGGLFGMALSPLTKLFELKVSGTLANPKSEPLFLISKIILMPLSPVKTIKDLMPQPEPRGTYAPPPPIPTPTIKEKP